MSQWLHEGLAAAGLKAVCIETRHAKAYLKAQVNKSDRNDARGIAAMMRVNLFKPVHVKSLASQKRRALLSASRIVLEKAIAVENDMRGLLRNFGLKVGAFGKAGFEARSDGACRRLMTIPGIGAVSALAYVATIDVPERFASSRAVGRSPGLSPRLNHTGERRRRSC